MKPSPEIIEAVPKSLHNEYTNRMRLLWATVGCMAINTGAFFAGWTNPQEAGYLLMLWMDSLALGMGSTYLNYIRKEKLMEKMSSLDVHTTYKVVESNPQVNPKGRIRLLRLMPPGLKAGIPVKWF